MIGLITTSPAPPFATPVVAAVWHETMVDYAVGFGIIFVAAGALACIIRLFRGPHLADRAVALDSLTVHVVAFVILLTLRLNSLVLFDGALVLSLVGFTGTVAVSQYIVRPHLRRRAMEEAAALAPDTAGQAPAEPTEEAAEPVDAESSPPLDQE